MMSTSENARCKALIRFLQDYRTSARAAMVLRLASMVVGGFASLAFTRLLLHSMGSSMYGAFLSFSALTRLGGLGDLGIGSGLATRANIMLGRAEDHALERMLSSARGLFLSVGAAMLVVFLLLSPSAPQWFGFTQEAVGGSPVLLFAVGSLACSIFVVAGYFHALNFACGTVTWPILPTLLTGQLLAPALHLVLAAQKFPLWVQCLPYAAATLLSGILAWIMLRMANPSLAKIFPISAKPQVWKNLGATSVWSFLTTLGTFIFLLTDRLIINLFFGSSAVPAYVLNYKLCELAITVLTTASFVSLPKITLWINSTEAADRVKGADGLRRLSLYQTTAGVAVGLTYLLVNNAFIDLWVGEGYRAPLFIQILFAAILVVYAGGDAAAMVASRCGNHGVRITGTAAAVCGLANLGLSLAAAAAGSIAGIAAASLLAQSALAIWMGSAACRYLSIETWRYSARCWLLPLAVISGAGALRFFFTLSTVLEFLALAILYVCLFALFCRLAGLRAYMIAEELQTSFNAFRKSLFPTGN